MDKIIIHQIAAMALHLGFLDEVKYRDYCIREEFRDMKNRSNDSNDCLLSTDEIEIELGDKYNITPESIHRIIYKKNE